MQCGAMEGSWQYTPAGTPTAQSLLCELSPDRTFCESVAVEAVTGSAFCLWTVRAKVKSTGEFVDGSEIGRLGQNAALSEAK